MSSETVADPTANPQAEAIFGQHHKEIKRRSQVVDSSGLNPASFPRSKEAANDLPFHIPGQEWVLFSVSHVRMSPVCEDPRKPSVRLYGLFQSAEEATDHARVVQQIDASVNLQVCRAHEWVSMRSTPERVRDDEATRRHVASLLSEYDAERRAASQEFQKNVQSKTGGSGTPASQEAERKRLSDRAREEANRLAGGVSGDETQTLRRATRLPRTAEVRDQSVAVVSFLPDSVQTIPEPLFRVYAAFGTQAEADVYVRNTVGEHVREVDVFVVSLCEWLLAQDIDSANLSNEVYRSEELSSVMSNHKSQPQKVEQFRTRGGAKMIM